MCTEILGFLCALTAEETLRVYIDAKKTPSVKLSVCYGEKSF